MKKTPKIVLIGAGNVGYHLGCRFRELGVEVLQVFSRDKKKAQTLAKKIDTKATNKLAKVTPEADIYILAVHDGAIAEVAAQLQFLDDKKRLFVHTSGATPSTVLKPYFRNYGIFYPLQTFSISRQANFEDIPICVDAKRKKHREQLLKLAKITSPKVYEVNDKQRAILHVAAVFVNNFTNHLFHIGENIVENEDLSFEILKPLIRETVAKIEMNKAATMQTGPAKRGDQNTIKRHLGFLKKYPDYAEIYAILSESIKRNG